MNRIAILSATLAILAHAAVAAAATEGAPSATRGRTLFLELGLQALSRNTRPRHQFRQAARAKPVAGRGNGSAGIRAPNTRMPAYSANVLSDADIADIAAYLATMPQPKSPDAIAILKDLKPTP